MTKKRFEMRVISFIISLAVLNMLILISPFAYAYEHGKTELNASDLIDAGKLTVSADVKLNGAEITSPTDIRSSDILTFSLDWKIDPTDIADYDDYVIVYDMSSILPNISLAEKSETINPNGKPDCVYTVSGKKLYIDILTGGDVTKRVGSFSFEGSLDLDDISTNELGEFTISFFDKSLILRAPENLPDTHIEKSASDKAFYNDGKYYQKFTVKLYNTGRVPAKNVTVTDTAGDLYIPGSISNVQYNGVGFTDYTVSGSNTIFNIGDLPANGNNYENFNTITYTMELDSGKLFSYSGNSENSVVAKPAVQPATSPSYAWANYSLPSLDKSGTYDAESSKITWTITVYPNILSDSTLENSFTIKDAPDSKLFTGEYTAADIAKAIPNATVSDGTITIPSSAFTKQSDGSYKLTYTTNVADGVQQDYSSVNIKNRAVLHYDDINYTDTRDTSVIIPPALGVEYISKDFENIEGSSLCWKQTIFVPENTKTITVTDELTELENNQNSAEFISNNYESLTITDGNGDSYTLTSTEEKDGGKILHYGNVGTIDLRWQWNSFANYTLTINDEDFLAANEGKYITVTYKTDMPSGVIAKCRNNANVKIVFTDGTDQSASDSADYNRPVTVTKYEDGFYNWNDLDSGSLRYGKAWAITLKNNSYTFIDGEKITVTEHLPEGMEYVDGTARLVIDGNNSGDWQSQIAVSGESDLTFTITVNSDIAEKLKVGKELKLLLITQMTNEYYMDFNSSTTSVERSFTNTADVKVGEAEYSSSCTVSIESTPEKILNKEIISSERNDQGFTASYKIVINSARADLVPGSDTIKVYDTLGSTLQLKSDTVVIIKKERKNNWGSFYDEDVTVSSDVMTITEDGQTMIFTLEDNTYYEITYDIESKPGSILYKSDLNPDSPDKATEEAINNELDRRYGNAVRIEGSGSNISSRSVRLAESSFRITSDISYAIKISGTKTWESNGYDSESSSRPDNITVVVTQHKDYIEGLGKDTQTDMKYHLITNGELPADAPDKNEYYIKPTISGDEWSFAIEDLTVRDKIGTTYTYYISEVKVNGYTTSYRYQNGPESWEDFNNAEFVIRDRPVAIEIINTFEGIETTDLTVTKEWLGDSEHPETRPNSLKLQLWQNCAAYTDWEKYDSVIEVSKNEWSMIENNKWQYTFSGLPKYYVMPDGTVTNYEYEYKVTEAECPDGYKQAPNNNDDYKYYLINEYESTEPEPTEPEQPSEPIVTTTSEDTTTTTTSEDTTTTTTTTSEDTTTTTTPTTTVTTTATESTTTATESTTTATESTTTATESTTTATESTTTATETTTTATESTTTATESTTTATESTTTATESTTTATETTTTAPVTTTTNHNTGGIVLPFFSSAETTDNTDDISADAAISVTAEQDSFGERMSAAFIIVAVIDTISAVALTVIIRRRKKNGN